MSLLCCIIVTKGKDISGTELRDPVDIEKCLYRPKSFKWPPSNYDDVVQHNYFYSADIPEFKDYRMDWLAARNLCRNYCMDAVSIETEEEHNMIVDFMKNHDIYNYVGPTWRGDGRCGPYFPFHDGLISQCDSIGPYPCCGDHGFCGPPGDYFSCDCPGCIDYSSQVDYLWTSGRLCDFTGCEDRDDLRPLNVRGWFWANNRKVIPDTNQTTWNDLPWSQTGHNLVPQPDNAEFGINGTPESCMAILNDLYEDGIKWHDIACYHKKPVLCEDDDELLEYMSTKHPQYFLY